MDVTIFRNVTFLDTVSASVHGIDTFKDTSMCKKLGQHLNVKCRQKM